MCTINGMTFRAPTCLYLYLCLCVCVCVCVCVMKAKNMSIIHSESVRTAQKAVFLR